MTSLLEFCPLDIAPGSVAAWLWDQAARDGEYAIGQTVCGAFGLVRRAARVHGLAEWEPAFDLVRHCFAGEYLGAEVRAVHGDLSRPDLDEDHPVAIAWSACELALDAFNLADRLGASGDWWADCASIVQWSMQAAELGQHILGIPTSEAIATCTDALRGSAIARRGALVVGERRRSTADALAKLAAWTPGQALADLLVGVGVSPERVAEAQRRGWDVAQWWSNTTVAWEQLAALGALGWSASQRAALLVHLAGPLVEQLPAAARLARRALEGAADRPSAFALAMGVMQEAARLTAGIEEDTLDHAWPADPERFASAIWHTGQVCALIALESAATENDRDLPAKLAEHLAHASAMLFEPGAYTPERFAEHRARVADRVRAYAPASEP